MKTLKSPKAMIVLSMVIFGTIAPFVRNISVSSGELALYRAVMAAVQLDDYLRYGNIKNSVNFPNVSMPVVCGHKRICVLHANAEGLASKITALYSGDFMTKTRGNYAYTMIDTDSYTDDAVAKTQAFEGVYKVNVI